MLEETRYCIALTQIKDFGPVLIKKLLLKFGSAKQIFDAEVMEIASVEGIGRERAKNLKNFDGWNNVDKILRICEKRDIKILSFHESDYPELLKEIHDPPPVLFCRGEIKPEDHYSLAIVGSRRPTEYGRKVTEHIASELALAGITIISGLARGIDSLAHISAISRGGRTLAVLGSGVSFIYPPENRTLAEKILKNGAILSEFLPDEGPRKENFPRRNRIISGISIGTLITEAGINSGALITAGFALEQGREVFAVPGNITSKNSEGTNLLIQKGAKLVTGLKDIVEEIGHFIPSLKKSNLKSLYEIVEVDDEEKAILNILDNTASVDELIIKSGMDITKILNILLKLEIKGLVTKTEGRYLKSIK